MGRCLLYVPQPGIEPQPRHTPCQRIEPATFWYMGRHSSQLSHRVRAESFFIDRELNQNWIQRIEILKVPVF